MVTIRNGCRLFVLACLVSCGVFAQPLFAQDFTATKSNDTAGAGSSGVAFTWSITVRNSGAAAGTFPTAGNILRDNLPSANITYGTPTVVTQSGVTGTIGCGIGSATLNCVAIGGVTFDPNGFITVEFSATPSSTGAFANPQAPGICRANADSTASETNANNNDCSDTVNVAPAASADLVAVKTNNVNGNTTNGDWTWSIQVSNSGSLDATFNAGQTILTDNLPNTDVAYGAPVIANQTDISGTGAISCSIVSFNLSCTASGGTVIFGSATGSFTVTVDAAATAGATFANPRNGGVCVADPNDNVAEDSEANNACADTVTVPASPDFSVTKTNDTAGAGNAGTPFNWFITVTNVGSVPANLLGLILTDNLPTPNVTYGTPTISSSSGVSGSAIDCQISPTSDLNCLALGTTIAAGGTFTVQVPTTPNTSGTLVNPRAGGECTVNPGNSAVAEVNSTNNSCSDTVNVAGATGPDVAVSKTNTVPGASATGPWNWLLNVSAGGTTDSTFSNGQTILVDNLPDTGLAYGAPTVGSVTGVTNAGNIDCNIVSSDLVCTANGADVTLASGSGSFVVTVPVTPTVAGAYANPRQGGVCAIDPNDNISEGDETNNSCADSVTVDPTPDFVITKSNDTAGVGALGVPFTWTLTATNVGDVAAVFSGFGVMILDSLPDSGLTYGTPQITDQGGISSGSFICNINPATILVCETAGATVDVNGFLTVEVTATPTAGGVFDNPRAGGSCQADGVNSIVELNEGNNGCSDTVTVSTDADVYVTKTDGVTTAIPGDTVTYTIVAGNFGPSSDPSVSLSDVFPAPLTNCTYTSVASGGASGNTAAGAGDLSETLNLPAGSSVSYDVTCDIPASATGTLFNTASVTGSLTDPDVGDNSATDNDTVLEPEADIEVTKTDGLTTVVPGESLVYTIVATNIGPSDDPAVSLNDTLPADLNCTFTSLAAGGASGNTAAGNGDLAETLAMPAGSSVTYTVACDIASSATGTLSNTAAATASVTDPVPGNNSATDDDTALAPEADVSITKTDGVTSAIPGQSLTYTIVAANAGPSDDPAVSLTDTLPADLGCTYTSVAAGGASGNTAAGAGDLSETLSMPAGSSVTYTLACDIASSATGTLSNTASVAASVTDPVPGNDTASDDDTVLEPEADVSVTKTDGVTSVIPGETLVYTIIATNNGPSDDPAVALADTLPAELTCTFTSVAAGGASGNTAAGSGDLAETLSMPAGSSVTYTVSCDVDSQAAGVTLSNTAAVTPSVTDPVPGNNSATDDDTMVIEQADISITKTDGVIEATPGDNLIYTIVVANAGPSPDPAVAVADTFPAGLDCSWTSVAAGGASGNTNSSGNLSDTLDMPAGSSVTYTVTCAIDPSATGTLSNTATATASIDDPDLTNNSATDDDTVLTPMADLSITKVANPDPAEVNAPLIYTVTVTNNGPSDAVAVEMVDTLDGSVESPVVNSSQGTCSIALPEVTCDLGTMAPGGEATITIEVNPGEAGSISNTAAVSSGTEDPTPANDTVAISTVITNADTTIRVTKDFSDDNPAEVEVVLACNTGLPLEQSAVIVDPDSAPGPGVFTEVDFVVGDFQSGEMNCEVHELVPAGYAPSYEASGDSDNSESVEGCAFIAIEGNHFNTCQIENKLQSVEVIVEKEWIDENPQFHYPEWVEVTLSCNAPIIGTCEGETDGICGYEGIQEQASAYIDPANPGEFHVLPHWDGSTVCSATEESQPGVIQDQDDCAMIALAPGVGGSCLLTNTRVYEGIPTLDRYGILLLTLLMLGVGMVGLRRLS